MEYSLSNACFGKIHLKKITKPMILNTEKSRKYRRNIYGTLNDIDTSKLKELSEIIEKSGQTKNILNKLDTLENSIDSTIVHLCSKEDTLEKLNTLNLKKLKDSFETIILYKNNCLKSIN